MSTQPLAVVGPQTQTLPYGTAQAGYHSGQEATNISLFLTSSDLTTAKEPFHLSLPFLHCLFAHQNTQWVGGCLEDLVCPVGG